MAELSQRDTAHIDHECWGWSRGWMFDANDIDSAMSAQYASIINDDKYVLLVENIIDTTGTADAEVVSKQIS